MAKARKAAAAKSSRKKSARSKPAETAGDGDSGGGGTGTISLISAAALTTLIKQVMIYQGKVDTASGDLGDLVRDYKSGKGLHTGAFGDIKKLYRMGKKDPGKLWLHLAHFDDMRKKLKLDDMAAAQGQMVGSGVDEDEEGEEAPGKQGGAGAQVHQLNAPRQTSEKAGETSAA